jgi:rubredoxin
MILSDISGLGKWSKKEIEVKCDVCELEKSLEFRLYTSYGYIEGEYLCRKCKLKKNNLEKYGVENVFQLESTKEKTKKTNLEKFGVEFISQSEKVKEKIKESFSKLDKEEVNRKRIETNKIKWGVENVSQLNSIEIKKVKTSIRNNGVDYIFRSDDFKKNQINSNRVKYGCDYLFQSVYFKEKSIKKNIEKWGSEAPSKNEFVIDKIKTSLKNTLSKKSFEKIDKLISIENEFYNIFCNSCNSKYSINRVLFYKRRETNTEICTVCNPIGKNQSGQ